MVLNLKIVIKGGMINLSVMGEANASIPTCQPELLRNMFGTCGKTIGSTCISFVSQYAYDHDIKGQLGLDRIVLPVRGIRNLTKKDMKFNDQMPELEVDPQTYDVTVNGELITCDPAEVSNQWLKDTSYSSR